MSILVTGAGGMVGSHLVEILHNENKKVVGTYYKPTVDITELDEAIKLIECDIRYPENIERVIFEYKPVQIFHLAAQSYPTVSWEKPYETMETNINGTIALFEAIKKLRKIDIDYDPVVVVACSSAEYGQTLNELEDSYVNEDALLKPLHPYGISKVGQDLLAYQYWMNDNIKCIRARIFNTTGTRKVNDVTSDFTKRAVTLQNTNFVSKKLIVGNIYSKRAIMDFRDLISALRLLASNGNYGEVYNISSEKVYEIKEIVDIIQDYMGIEFDLEVDDKLLRPTDEKIIVGNVSKLKNDTGWKQTILLKDTVKDMLTYWQNKIINR